MKKFLILPLLCAANFAAADCPPIPDRSGEIDPLMTAIRDAPNESLARDIGRQLWDIWATAPDSRAQVLLDGGLADMRAGNLIGARSHFDGLVEYCPDYAEGYNQRAFVAFLSGKYPEALVDLELALARDPDHIAALAGKALTEIGIGGAEAGQETLRSALRLNPWLSERRYLLEPMDQDI